MCAFRMAKQLRQADVIKLLTVQIRAQIITQIPTKETPS